MSLAIFYSALEKYLAVYLPLSPTTRLFNEYPVVYMYISIKSFRCMFWLVIPFAHSTSESIAIIYIYIYMNCRFLLTSFYWCYGNVYEDREAYCQGCWSCDIWSSPVQVLLFTTHWTCSQLAWVQLLNWLCFVYSQLICLLPVEIFTTLCLFTMFVSNLFVRV